MSKREQPAPSVESLFLRYVEQGDPAALGAVFDRVGPELFAVAAHLAGDPARAEDAVQETFLAAIESSDRYSTGRPLVPWLMGILTHRVRNQRRRDARSPQPERLPVREVEEPEKESARGELFAALESALELLPAAYREVLLPYLTGDERPREIARRVGRAPGTVRVQVHRGLELLRKALPPSFALGAAATLTPSRGLAAVRGKVMEAAGAKAKVAGTSLAVAGGFLSVRTFGAVLGLSLLGGSSWLAWSAVDAGASVPPMVLEPVALATPSSHDEVDLVRPDTPRNDPVPRATRPAPEPPAPEPSPEILEEEPVAAPRYVLGRLAGTDLTSGKSATVEVFRLPEGWRDVLVGRELKASGPLLGGGARDLPRAVTSTLFDGTFELNVTELWAEADSWTELAVRVDHPDYLPTVTGPLNGHLFRIGWLDGMAAEVAVHPREPHARLELDVRSPNRPVTVALFPLTSRGHPSSAPTDSSTLTVGHLTLRAADAGPHVVVASAEGLAPLTLPVEVNGDLRLEEPLVLDTGAPLQGTLRLPGELSAEGWTLTAVAPQRYSSRTEVRWGDLVWSGEGFLRPRVEVEVDPDGLFLFEGLLPGYHKLIAQSSAFGEAPTENWYKAPAVDVNLVAPLAIVRFEVRGAEGPLAGAKVSLSGSARGRTTDAEGAVEMLLASGEKRTVQVALDGYRHHEAPIQTPHAGQRIVAPILLRTDDGSWDGRLTIVAEGDAPPPSLCVDWWQEDGMELPLTQVVERRGRTYTLNGLPRGELECSVRPTDAAPFTCAVAFEADLRDGSDDVELALPQGGRLCVSVGRTVGVARLELTSDHSATRRALERLDLRFTYSDDGAPPAATRGVQAGGRVYQANKPLPEGEYELRVSDGAGLLALQTVSVRAGLEREVRVDGRPPRK